MKSIKKVLTALMALLLAASFLVSCATGGSLANTTDTGDGTTGTGTGDTTSAETTAPETTEEPVKNELGVSFEGASFLYDGEVKSLAIDGELPEGVSVTYEGNDKTDVGEYTVTASFTSTNEEYTDIPPLTAVLRIYGKVLINEVCSNNTNVIKDSHGVYSDYIELYNPNDFEIDLKGYTLSDNPQKLDKFEFKSVKIPAKSFLLVFASESDSTAEEIHASFKLSSGGEIVHVAFDGELLDSLTLPTLEDNRVVGRTNDGGEELSYMSATPGATNADATNKEDYIIVPVPTFSKNSGFYSDPIEVYISMPAGCKVYYTLDGSNPTENSTRYMGGPLDFADATEKDNVLSERKDVTTGSYGRPKYKIDKANILRAIAVDEEGNVSKIATSSFFVGFDNKIGYDDVTIISLVTDPSNLFDYNTGIYVKGKYYDAWVESGVDQGLAEYYQPANWTQRGAEWEREAHIDFFESDDNHSYIFSQEVGIRIKGESSRFSAQKSLNVYARTRYDGNSDIQYNIFDPDTDLSGFVLRNGGNDIFSAKIRDPLHQELVMDRNFGAQRTRPCVLFIDGEFWAIYSLTEKIDEHYVENHYGVSEDNQVIIKCNTLEHGEEGDEGLYWEMMAYAKADLSKPAVYKEFLKHIDIQSYIDYVCAEVYIANFDWPIHNEACWRSKTVNPDNPYEDGKWRWLMYDVDFASGLFGNMPVNANNFQSKLAGNELFRALMNNREFVAQFVTTFMDMANKNFEKNTVNAKIDEYVEVYAVPFAEYSRRFFYGNTTEAQFRSIVNNEIRMFFNYRGQYVTNYMKQFFRLNTNLTTLNVSESIVGAGDIRLNTIDLPLNASGSWSGQYFADFTLSITAKAREGYKFVKWEVGEGISLGDDPKNATIEFDIVDSSGVTLKAVYEVDERYENRETLVEFDYKDGTPSTDLTTGSKNNGYVGTSGVFVNSARLFASVNGKTNKKLEWSGKTYGSTVPPVVDASASNPWAEGAYFEVKLRTTGYRDIMLSAKLGATNSGARDFKLQYSLDGKNYVDIADSAYSISDNKEMFDAYTSFALPEAVANQSSVYIRIAVASGYTVEGTETLYGSASGEIAINNVSVYGRK